MSLKFQFAFWLVNAYCRFMSFGISLFIYIHHLISFMIGLLQKQQKNRQNNRKKLLMKFREKLLHRVSNVLQMFVLIKLKFDWISFLLSFYFKYFLFWFSCSLMQILFELNKRFNGQTHCFTSWRYFCHFLFQRGFSSTLMYFYLMSSQFGVYFVKCKINFERKNLFTEFLWYIKFFSSQEIKTRLKVLKIPRVLLKQFF